MHVSLQEIGYVRDAFAMNMGCLAEILFIHIHDGDVGLLLQHGSGVFEKVGVQTIVGVQWKDIAPLCFPYAGVSRVR
jgi:hypothetical protein